MLSRLQNKLGTAGLVVAVVALVAAMTGAAFAAGGLTKSQEKQVTKIAKKYAGKNGINGANGAAGEKGPKGDPGTNGAPGESVTISPISSPGCNGQSGTKFKNATGEGKACNGTTGFTSTLPSGKTETGIWSAPTNLDPTEVSVWIDFSFPIPLADNSTYTVNWINPAGTAEVGDIANCDGSVTDPSADPGNLCVYTNPGSEKIGEPFPFSALVQEDEGVIATIKLKNAGTALGTWAVTAP